MRGGNNMSSVSEHVHQKRPCIRQPHLGHRRDQLFSGRPHADSRVALRDRLHAPRTFGGSHVLARRAAASRPRSCRRPRHHSGAHAVGVGDQARRHDVDHACAGYAAEERRGRARNQSGQHRDRGSLSAARSGDRAHRVGAEGRHRCRRHRRTTVPRESRQGARRAAAAATQRSARCRCARSPAASARGS